MSNYSRPASGFRLQFGGVKTNAIPDALPEFKYPFAQNVRSYLDSSIQSRPQIIQAIAAPVSGGPVLALEPTIGVYKIGSSLFVNAVQIDTGYTPGIPCSILPFRPNASPNAYDYVFDALKMTKVYVPSSGVPVVNKTGLAEPQDPPDACPDILNIRPLPDGAGNWGPSGTAGALSDVNRTTDIVAGLFPDPASVAPTLATRYSMQIGNVQYQKNQTITVAALGGGSQVMAVQDVLPPVNNQAALTIQSIFYFAGTTGRCIIETSQSPIDNTVPVVDDISSLAASLNFAQPLAALRRGSLIHIGTGGTAETVFVMSVTGGPQGLLAIECVTVNNHAIAEVITGLSAIAVSFTQTPATFIGQAISCNSVQSSIAVGTGNISQAFVAAANPFVIGPIITDPVNPTPQEADYIHCSFNMDNLSNVTNIRVEFDVNNGAADFAQNAFYFDIRPNDLLQAVTGVISQLGAVQLAVQRRAIDHSVGIIANTGGRTGERNTPRLPSDDSGIPDFGSSSDQTTLGNTQWSEVVFPISALTRIGNDQTRTLANCQQMRIAVTVTATTVFKFGSVWFSSGGQADVGDSGELYFYRVQPRNSVTGNVGNPSPSARYGVSPRRQKVVVTPPSSAYDPQIDTWDYYRVGGQLTAWRYIGSAPIGQEYVDNVFDLAIVNNDTLTFDCLEPWPGIGPSIAALSSTAIGMVMVAVFPTASALPSGFGTLSQLGNLLPGNLFSVGPNTFTLFKRPIAISATPTTQTWLLQFVENAGSLTNPFVQCQEPLLAAQATDNVWGPDANGIMFAVGAGGNQNNGVALRPGLIQWSNPNDPDCSSDANTRELCPTSEPLQNGIIVEGTPIVLSAKRGWRGISRQDEQGNIVYDWQEIPLGRGLAAQFGLCTDGQIGYYVTSDGIVRTGGGRAESITDNDLSNLFPHEAIFPQDVTYCGNTIFAPEYKYAVNFQLEIINGFLYFDYLDKTQTYRTLVYDTRKDSWVPDVYVTPVSVHAGVTVPAANNVAPGGAIRNQVLFTGDIAGVVGVEQSFPSVNTGEIVSCIACTREEVIGDLRANKMFGDAMVDLLAPGGAVTITPIFLGVLFNTATIIAGGMVARPASPPTVNLNGQSLQRSMGLQFSWADQGVTTLLHSWQPSYVTQPEDISNRVTDWDDAGTPGNKFIQGFQIDLDTANQIKALIVRDNDTQSLHSFTSDNAALAANQVQANGRRLVTCAFIQPFAAHMVRLESLENKIYRLFSIKWIAEPTPEAALLWQTQATSFGRPGYSHVKEILAAYVSQAPVILTITCFDGLSPAQIVLPNTNGGYQKLRFPLSPNKGLLYTFSGQSTKPWQCFMSDWEIKIKAWGSSGAYESVQLLGNQHGATAGI